jgi:hypothetical protein
VPASLQLTSPARHVSAAALASLYCCFSPLWSRLAQGVNQMSILVIPCICCGFGSSGALVQALAQAFSVSLARKPLCQNGRCSVSEACDSRPHRLSESRPEVTSNHAFPRPACCSTKTLHSSRTACHGCSWGCEKVRSWPGSLAGSSVHCSKHCELPAHAMAPAPPAQLLPSAFQL